MADQPLMFAGIKALIDVKESEGVYMPKVTNAQAKGNRVRKQINLVSEGRCIRDLFDDAGDIGKICLIFKLWNTTSL